MTRVEIVGHDEWDASIFVGMQGVIVDQPENALPYESNWPWVKLDQKPIGFPEKHNRIFMFNPKVLRKIDD